MGHANTLGRNSEMGDHVARRRVRIRHDAPGDARVMQRAKMQKHPGEWRIGRTVPEITDVVDRRDRWHRAAQRNHVRGDKEKVGAAA